MEPTFEPDVQMPGFMQNVMNEADEDHFEEGETPPEPQEDVDTFDGDVGQDVTGLLNLGKLTKRFEVLGHTFFLKTLTIGEELAIAQVVNEYAGTIGQGKAFQTAILAAAIVSVDGRELVAALGPDTQASIQDRFDYITRGWFPSTIDQIFLAYQELLERQQAAYEDLLGKS